jgi:hypothetical protein
MRAISWPGKLKQTLENIRSGLWFLPKVITSLAATLAAGLVEADRQLGYTIWDRRP